MPVGLPSGAGEERVGVATRTAAALVREDRANVRVDADRPREAGVGGQRSRMFML